MNGNLIDTSENSILENNGHTVVFKDNEFKTCVDNECTIIYKHPDLTTNLILELHIDGYININDKDTNKTVWSSNPEITQGITQSINNFLNVSDDTKFKLIITESGELKIVDFNNNLIWSIMHPYTTHPYTTQPNTTTPILSDITQLFPNILPETMIKLLNSGINMATLLSNKNSITKKGIQFDSNIKGPSTNIYQKNFSGTSNVYSPYLYYNKNKDDNLI